LLREAGDITGIGRAFQSVEENDLTPRSGRRLVFISDNRDARIDGVLNLRGRKARLIDFARPEITGDGEQMGIAEKRLEWLGQIPIVTTEKCGPGG
jgi:hypothetical protein